MDTQGLRPRAAGARSGLNGHAGAPAPTVSRTHVIVPVFNEARGIGRTADHTVDFARTHPEFSFLFVDDGSTDQTASIVRDRIRSADRVALHSLGSNRGKGCAVRAGVERALHALAIEGREDSGRVCFIDGDLAYGFDHLIALAAALETWDVVIGSRHLAPEDTRHTTLARRIMGGTFNALARAMIALPHRDTQAGLKGFRARAAREIFKRQRLSGFAFDAELIFLARRLGCSVGEIPARVSPDHSYKLSKVDLVREPFRMFRALLSIRTGAARGRYD